MSELVITGRAVKGIDAVENPSTPHGSVEFTKRGIWIKAADGQIYTSAVSNLGKLYWRRLRFDRTLETMSPAQRDRIRHFGQIAARAPKGLHEIRLTTGKIVKGPSVARLVQDEMTGWKSQAPRSNLKQDVIDKRNAIIEAAISHLEDPQQEAKPQPIMLDRLSEFALMLKGR